MSPTLALVDQFGDAVNFILQPRESVTGGVMVGGLGEIGQLAGNHMLLSAVAMLVATAVSVPIGVYLGHYGKGQFVAINVSNVGRAVPALALLAFFIAYLGNGFLNVATVLLLLALPPILTNAYVGTQQVDRDTVDAARGMGFSDGQIIRRVELPLALPTIFGGIRTSAVNVVATATIAPLASVQTLGTPIVEEQTYGDTGQLAAAILVALIAVAADVGIGGLQRAVTPRGLKLAAAPTDKRQGPLTAIRRRAQATP